ncbi:NAD(P)-dependent oxidoreductase [Peribacillus butanolivorans]|uniref:NAD(P)-dependent oxidoreductase n=1 Tax=Peribacillus butanolivorans TaxID=421767 RepID=UPI00367BD87E
MFNDNKVFGLLKRVHYVNNSSQCRNQHFQQMKDTAIIVNTARSGLIKEDDLIQALQKGAAIDTFDHEPLGDNSPFLQLDNVTIGCFFLQIPLLNHLYFPYN